MFNVIKFFWNYAIINARFIVKEVYSFGFSDLFEVLKKVLNLLEIFNFIALNPAKVIFLYYIY